jgi:hypothetical protein
MMIFMFQRYIFFRNMRQVENVFFNILNLSYISRQGQGGF